MALNVKIGIKKMKITTKKTFLTAMDPFYNQAFKLWELIT
jgi:hypothetical protein